MTLAIILFLLAITVIMLLAIPLTMLIAPDDWPDIWANIKFWFIVVSCWVGVAWVAMSA
jgi:hypothetical protein